MVVVNVDDTSSDINYAGTWYPGGSADEYGGTSHGVSVAGATATFSFTGTQVVVYGSVSNIDFSQAPVSTYSIDGGQQWTYVASPGPDNQYRVPFYKSPQLTQGTHTLVIKTTRPSTHYWLDYIQYSYDQDISAVPSIVLPPATSTSPPAQQNNPATTHAAASQTTTASTGGSTPGSVQGSGSAHSGGISNGLTTPGQTNGGNPTAIYSISVSTEAGSSPQATGSETTNSDVNSTSAGSSKISRTGTIAGAVVGSLVLVATIIILVWLLARKRRRDSSSSPESSPHMDQAEPFAPVPGGFGGYPQEGQMRKQAEMDHTPSNSGASQDAGDHPGLPAASDDMQPPPISVASLSGYHPPVDHDGQPYIVVYQPMPAEAPPSYRLRQSAATFAARES